MWRAFGSKIPGIKSVKSGFLLAYITIRCIKQGQNMWQMSITCLNSIYPNIAVTAYIPTHFFRSMGFRHSRSIPISIGSKKILSSSHWLLYQMDQGGGISHHYNKKGRSSDMKIHHLSIWSTESYCYRPWNAIWLWLLQKILWQPGDSNTVRVSGISTG